MIQNEICCGENIKLGSNGKMNCISGKRMKKENRVFFLSEQPNYKVIDFCGHSMNMEYKNGDGFKQSKLSKGFHLFLNVTVACNGSC